eukprot:gene14746-19821_t
MSDQLKSFDGNRGRRKGALWKSQEDLTQLGLITPNIDLESQLKVKIALKSMRKVEQLRDITLNDMNVGFMAIPKNMKYDDYIYEEKPIDMYYDILSKEYAPLPMKSFDQMHHDAKINVQVTKQKNKLYENTSSLGIPKPMFKELIEDINQEQKRLLGQKTFTAADNTNNNQNNTIGIANLRPLSAPSHLGKSRKNSNLTQVRKKSANQVFNKPLAHPLDASSSELSAGITMVYNIDEINNVNRKILSFDNNDSKNNSIENIIKNNNNIINLSIKPPAPIQTNDSPRLFTKSDKKPSDTLLKHQIKRINSNLSIKYSPQNSNNLSRSGSPMSSFSPSQVDNDPRIQKARRVREELFAVREEELARKAIHRMIKSENRKKESLQIVWAAIITLVSRESILFTKIITRREKLQLNKDLKMHSRVVKFIEKWWESARIKWKIKRNPKLSLIAKSAINLFAIKFRLKKKNNSANLIKSFLNDSNGISEYMRKIYFFRHQIIKLQRYIRSWIEIQMLRMKLLWMAAEKMQIKIAINDKNNKRKQEKISMQELSKMEKFGDTVTNINRMKKRLEKIFERQVEI